MARKNLKIETGPQGVIIVHATSSMDNPVDLLRRAAQRIRVGKLACIAGQRYMRIDARKYSVRWSRPVEQLRLFT